MNKTHATLAAVGLTMVAVATPTQADVFIALQEAGVNGGARTTVATDSSFANFVGAYGAFTINAITASQLTAPMDSTALDVSGVAPGELKIFVSSTNNIGSGTQEFLSGLTMNLLPAGWTGALLTYLDTGNTSFGLTTPLGANVFSNIGSLAEFTTAALSGSYSITGVYDIVATGTGTSLATIHVSPNPIIEPSSIFLLIGFCALAFAAGKVRIV